jgi:ribose/xylose/arabinose/galactoside ABC-type transport system permease subunit
MLTNSKFLGSLVELSLIYAVLAAGMSLLLVAGEADLSIGGVASLAAIVMIGLTTNYDVPAPAAVMVALALGLLIGLVNGLLIVGLRLPFYVVTLAMSSLTLGLGFVLSGARVLALRGRPFEGSLLLLLVLNLAVYGLVVLVLFLLGRFTSLGKLRSLNARTEAEGRPGGLALGLYKVGAYTVCGLLAALAGSAMLNLYRIATPGGYTNLTIVAIAAAVIGGVPLWKGSTRLLGAFLGSAALALTRQVMLVPVGDVRLYPELTWAVLALAAAVLWGVAGWVLDLVFGRRKGTQVGDAVPHVTGGDR